MSIRSRKARSAVRSTALGLMVLGLAGLGYAGSAAAQGGDWKAKWDAVVAAAEKEGKVVVWGPGGSAIRQAQREFEKDFPGIKMEYSGGRGTSMATKLNAQRDGGLFLVDVFINGPTTANFILKPAKALDPLPPVLILPEVTNPKNWWDGGIEYTDKDQKYNIAFFTQVSPQLVYNPKLVKEEEIDTLQKLLNPKFKGKITVNDPSTTGSGVPWFRRLWVEMGPEKAEDYYRKLRAQVGAMTRDTRVQVEWVAQGKFAILVAPSTSAFQQLRARGVKFGVLQDFADIKSHTGSSTGTVSLVNKAPHPNAAIVYINWLLSKRGQEVWQGAINVASRRVDVAKDQPLVAESAPRKGVKYWPSYTEENQARSAKEAAVIKSVFSR
jgi:iron(III) transport system substrate-binding protein